MQRSQTHTSRNSKQSAKGDSFAEPDRQNRTKNDARTPHSKAGRIRKGPTVQRKTANGLIETIIPRDKHGISRDNISENALKVLYRLNKAGYESYLVGGGVRDLLLGNKPKDFDVCTNATPTQIKKLFSNCRIIGRRFQLAHIVYGREIIEVATFRGPHDGEASDKNSAQAQNGMLVRDNIFGTLEQDAARRDFTINCLYYSVKDFSVRDFAGGIEDLKRGVIKLIGEPETRYKEDPVRMLRAVRFAAKLNMQISAETGNPIYKMGGLLSAIPPARLFDESLKLLQGGYGLASLKKLREYKLFGLLFPLLNDWLDEQTDTPFTRMVDQVLINTDERIALELGVNPAFLFAALLWYPLLEKAKTIKNVSGLTDYDAFMLAMNDLLDEQCKTLAITKRVTLTMRDIWQLQSQFVRYRGAKAQKLLSTNKFRAGFDLLKLRASVERNQEIQQLAQWWENFQLDNPISDNYNNHEDSDAGSNNDIRRIQFERPEDHDTKRQFKKPRRRKAPSKLPKA